MNYRHAYHAGNFADVAKHLALVAILLHLARKDTSFAVIDTHAGRGRYDLGGDEAVKTGEAASGIARLADVADTPSMALNRYLEIVRDCGAGVYPGSPLIAARLLRPQDTLTAIEKQPQEAALLKQALSPFRRARVEEGDGYARLAALLPPPARRGLVLIDPPFEAADEFAALATALRGALRRFANGVYLIWYPVKAQAAANAFAGEVLAAGATRALRVEIAVAAAEGKLARAALLIVNPSFGLDKELAAALDIVAAPLSAQVRIDWLAGP